VRPFKPVLIAPHGQSSWAALVQFCFRITKYKAQVYLWALVFNEQVLLPVCDSEASLCFDIKKAPRLGELEVWCIFRQPGWPLEGHSVGFEQHL